MKKNKNFAFGFTVAELLITMLISALVAAAMVPVIGLKKVKSPKNMYNHGIAECYYAPTGFDANGDATDWTLQFYYADNRRRNGSGGGGVTAGEGGRDYCSFQPPKAEFYEIIAIGAGTDGVSMVPVMHQFTNGEVQSGFISLGKNFQASLNDARINLGYGQVKYIGNDLRNIIKKWEESARADELYAEYTLVSPVGHAGVGKCYKEEELDSNFPARFANCEKSLYDKVIIWPDSYYNSTPAEYCATYHAAAGSDSGRGMEVYYKWETIDPYINPGIKTSDTVTSLSLPRVNIILNAAEKGKSPTYEHHRFIDPTEKAKDATCSGTNCGGAKIIENLVNKASKKFGIGADDKCTIPANPSTPGKVYYGPKRERQYETDEVLIWEYNPLSANPSTGTAGQPGEEKSVVYENLKSTIYMIPAPYMTDESQFGVNNKTIVMTDLDDEESILVSAKSAEVAGKQEEIPFTLVNSDIPIPSVPLHAAKPFNQDKLNYIAKLAATPYQGGLKGCEIPGNTGEWCPGFAGKGVYFYIERVPDIATISIKHRDHPDKPFAVPSEDIKQDIILNRGLSGCDDGFTRPADWENFQYAKPDGSIGDFEMQYCKEKKTKGSPGAVIIMW